MDENVRPGPARQGSLLPKIGIYAAVAIIAFLAGLVPMWLKASEGNRKLATAENELRLIRMHHTLAGAVIDARRGDYEPARQATSQFFTALRAETEPQIDSPLTAKQKEQAQSLFAARDDLITLLARSDPAAADRLSDLYVTYRQAITSPDSTEKK